MRNYSNNASLDPGAGTGSLREQEMNGAGGAKREEDLAKRAQRRRAQRRQLGGGEEPQMTQMNADLTTDYTDETDFLLNNALLDPAAPEQDRFANRR